MAVIDPLVISSGDVEILIRPARPEDAAALNEFNRSVREHRDGRSADPETSNATMAAALGDITSDPQRLRLLAMHANTIVGAIDFVSPSKLRTRHRGRLGLAVAAAWRGRGIGTSLIRAVIGWAGSHPYLRKIRLSVPAENTLAFGLYRRLGFIVEGTRRGEILCPDGNYDDEIQMCLWVKPGPDAVESDPASGKK